MKRILLISVLVIFGFGALYVGYNQLDAASARMDIDGVDSSSEQALINSLFPTPSFDASNGYYRLFSLTEAVDVDVESSEVILKYRRLHDPQYDNDKYIEQWNKDKEKVKFRMDDSESYHMFKEKRKDILAKSKDNWDNFDKDPTVDWCGKVVANRQYVEELKELLKVHYARYEKLVKCELFEDFTQIRKITPLPNLLAWLHLSKLYVNVNMLEAKDGHWDSAVSNLLAQVRLNKKAVKNGRTLILNLVAKANMRMALRGILSLMNQPECPDHVYDTVIAGLPPLKYMEYGSRNPILIEGYMSTQAVKGGIFLQENRTRQYYYDYFVRLVKCEELPPYQWESHPTDDDVNSGWFWWVRNPAGKKKYQKAIKSKLFNNMFTVVYKSNWLRSDYMITRIAAEVHKESRANPKLDVAQVLDRLPIYKEWIDPCSGKPFTWDPKRQLLYSFGTDRDDDGGKVDMASLDSDFALAITPFIR